MRQKHYNVARIDKDCIRVMLSDDSRTAEPRSQQAASSPKPRVSTVRLIDYGGDEGFSITPLLSKDKLKPPTIAKLREFPICKIYQSKNRINIRLSFDRAAAADAQKIVVRDHDAWFEAIRNFLLEQESEPPAETQPRAKARKSKQKTKS